MMFGIFKRKAQNKQDRKDLDFSAQLHSKGMFFDASNLCKSVSKRGGDFAGEAAFGAATSLLELGEYDQASDWLARAVEHGFGDGVDELRAKLDKISSQACVEAGRFTLDVGQAPTPVVDMLVSMLTDPSRVFEDEQTLQVGAMLFRVARREDERLTLQGPVPQSMPIVWSEKLEWPLLSILHQRYVADSLGLSSLMDFTSLLEPVAFQGDILYGETLRLSREEPTDNGVSWFIQGSMEDPAVAAMGVQVMSAWELTKMLPVFSIFWGLPRGVQIELTARVGIEVHYQGSPSSVAPDSFLERFMAEHKDAGRWRPRAPRHR